MRRLALAIAGFLGLAAPALAQGPNFPPQPQLVPQLPPLFYVKFIAPKGAQLTVYRGEAKPQTFDMPATVGFRPGYCYRLAITGVPGYEKDAFFPYLEVRGSLMLGGKLRNADFPAALVFTAEDFAKVKADAVLKRVIVLERPETAVPVASKADAPIEIAVEPNRDPLNEALNKGAILAVMHLGERTFTPQELAEQNVPGTIMLPGEKILPAPRQRPCVQWSCYPLVDPLLGPANPSELMAICDGCDVGLPAGVTRNGKIVGLDPTDTVSAYVDSKGKRHLAVSNRVCLCVPRFIIIMGESIVASQVARVGPGATTVAQGQAMFHVKQPLQEHIQTEQVEGLGTRAKPSGTVQTIGTSVTARVEGLKVTGILERTREVDAQCGRPEPTEPPDGPLCIIKWPDKCGALVGDIVTFTVKYTNTGGQPISNIVVVDSLTTRLQYVPGSAKADRDAVFTTQANEAGSLILHWEISGQLQPRESGIVTFQVKIR